MQGKLIVIEGLDGSGKATQAKMLFEHLANKGVSVKSVTFPNYESRSSSLAVMYLSGEFGQNADDVNAYAASTFYAVDRYASFKTIWGAFYKDGGIVVSDRYTTSNAVHQCAKLPAAEWRGYTQWLFDFEYNKMGIPAPAEVIYLDMLPAISQKLISARYGNIETKKDIHEKDIVYLQKCRDAALFCAAEYGWKHIKCDDGTNALSIDAVHKKVLAALAAHI